LVFNTEPCITGQECYKRKEKIIYNTILKSIATYGCEVWQIKEINKKYWLWKSTFDTDQQDHLQEKRLEMKSLEKIDIKQNS
jgi:hypothetical protein